MVIITVHNYYQVAGGEDRVFEDESALLESYGHRVIRFTRHNDSIGETAPIRLAAAAVWNHHVYHEIRALIRREKADVVHVHNTLPLISPSVYYAAKTERVAVVQTLHNYRLYCPGANFFRDGVVCEDCAQKMIPWPAIRHSCYRDNRGATAVVAGTIGTHRLWGTWARQIDVYIAPSQFTRLKLVECGLSPESIVHKPHFVWPDPGIGLGSGGYGLFVGRLSDEKGILTLLAAAERLDPSHELKIVGTGPLAAEIATVTTRLPGLSWLGRLEPHAVMDLIGDAKFVLVPSDCYETFARVILEAYAKGTPVIGSDRGAVGDLIAHGRTGFHFRAGDAEELARTIEYVYERDAELPRLRRNARREYTTRFSPDRSYELLMQAYAYARERAAVGSG